MTKREFMQQFVLNRASVVDQIHGDASAAAALAAWDYIETVCRTEPEPEQVTHTVTWIPSTPGVRQ